MTSLRIEPKLGPEPAALPGPPLGDVGGIVAHPGERGIGIGGNGRCRHGQALSISMVRWSIRRVAVMTLRFAS